MAEPGSTHILQVIHEIKDSVERPHRRRWLENIGYEDGSRARTRRYVDGAVKIMDLLRPEVSSGDIRSYEHLYDEFCELPDTWIGARLNAAKRLWEYVGSLDERTSHERVTSVPYEPYHEDTPHSSRRTFGDS
ncbi:uncharacterized protein TRAVEDRAFT_69084, partial [Trametes versicolor FP-101664 SS1]|uniref:uncharacterized protein n=1 Tax=Trametes versicolor (strain FP-101664) TaxID=717944 RepID=UPI0004624585